MKIGYARVSTEEQNLDLQRQALQAAGCDSLYEDHGVSGSAVERPGLAKALAKAGSGADAVAEWRQRHAGRAAEPEIRAKLNADRIDANPDHASAWLASQGDFDSNLAGLCGARVRFELNVPHDAVCFGHKVEAALIDLGPKDLDIACPIAPKALQKIAEEPMLDHVLARARQR